MQRMRTGFLVLSALVVTLAVCSEPASAAWVSASGGEVPAGAVVAGQESDGEALYLCRASYGDGVHPGKVRPAFGGCNIGWGGRELSVGDYEVYVAGWVASSDGQVPENAMQAGSEADGAALYICRGEYNGGVHPGKIRPEFEACNLTWGGKEVKVREYEVLVG